MPPYGLGRYAAGQRMARHRHDVGYAVLVLEGGYVEAGEHGRLKVGPGDALLHRRWDSHFDILGGTGAKVLNLPFAGRIVLPFGTIADPDDIVRLAEESLMDAASKLASTMELGAEVVEDWPDLLASALRRAVSAGRGMNVAAWADRHHLRPQSVSRGFRQTYGTSPKRYLADLRAACAARQICRSNDALVTIAADLGFADQAHMTRAVTAMTRRSPRAHRG